MYKALLWGIIVLIGCVVFSSKTSQEPDLSLKTLCLIGTDTLIGGHPLMLKPQILATIMECESGGDPKACNTCQGTQWEGLYDPSNCPCGAGLSGIIPSTLKYCEEKLDRKLDVFDPVDNESCAIWLYENEGLRHWSQSEKCWRGY